jgi:mRNA-degrading endonuclease toxin of MazEF toxin-antitoxin module
VYVVRCPLPDRDAGTGYITKSKWVVLLQGEDKFRNAADIAVVVASTWRAESPEHAPFEVLMGSGDGFQHRSVVDARWPFTLLKKDIRRGTYKTTLAGTTMEAISVALVIGLGL